MSARLGFRTVDGAAGVEFTLRERAGWYALPLITLDTGGAEVWVESWRLTAEPGARPDLLSAVLSAWRPSAAAEHGASLVSRPVRVAATGVDRPVDLRLRWAVGYHVTSPYTRLYNATEPLREEQVVTLRFDPPAGPAPAARPGSPARNQEPEPHLGHIAIDFGTSNCTVTLFDQNKLPVRPLSLQQATRLRDELAKLLGERAAFGPGTEAEWEALVAELGDSVRPGTHEDPDRLRARLRADLAADDPDNPRVLYRVIVELERRIGNCSETLRPRLAVALDEACRGAWSVPSLDRLRLFPVSLDEFEGVQLESKVTPLAADGPLRVRVGKPQFGVVGGAQGETRVYAGLKQRLAQSVDFPELGAGVSSDDLLREALRDLVERTNTYVATGPAELGGGRIGNVVITYPTMATPVVRHKLRDMVRALGIDRVDTSYDEAVAAAMFFLLRDFGGDHDIGLDVLRSRCREVPGHTDRWQQNLLVIDIGGGTSDIALLTLGVQDATPVMDGDPRLHGRYYELRPTLRGSTGGLQLGGELLTLRVFYWIKALLADRLWDLYPERFAAREAELLLLKLVGDERGRVRLTEHVLHEVRQDHDGGGGGRSRSTILDVLDRIVPTRSGPGRGHPTQAFWLLWDLSEQIKLEFCAQAPPERLVLPDAKLHQVLRAVPDGGSGTAPYADLPGQAKFELELSAARFEELIAPDLDEVMDMARDLVVKRLGSVAGGAPERLDRVVLTGQTSRAPLVRRRLVHSFASAKDRSTAVDWRPSSIVVEHEYGKHATSIGACWAKASQSLTQRPEGAVARLKDGHNELYIDVKNLLFHLPCRFRRSTNVGGSETGRLIFDLDTELFQLDPRSDTAAARSEQFQLSKIVAVFRDGKSPMLRWGEYQWDRVDPNRDPEVMAHEMWARIEATSDLDLFILIYRNRPHYLVEGRGVRVGGLVGAAHEERFRIGRRPRLRAQDIVVNAFVLGGDHEGVQVFPDEPAGQAGPADPAAGPFPETFHTESGVVRGIIGSPLPSPPRRANWTFHRRDESGHLTQIGELPVPPRDGDLPVRYRATLDEQGTLRVHAGEVPFWPAEDLAMAEAEPGRVLRAEMPLTTQGYNTARDPFNGRH